MTSTKMRWDSAEYLNALRIFQRVMHFRTQRQAEEILFPIRAAKRRMKILERQELESTCFKVRKLRSEKNVR